MSSVRSQASGSTRMRIRNFPAAMDEKYVTQVWEMLKKAIQEIQRKNNSGLSFEELYRNAYTMVLHKYGERLYTGLKQVVEDHLRNNVRVKIVESLDSGNFLEVINETWSDHTTAMVMIRDILMYMDRVYVEQNKVEQVFHLGLAIFRNFRCFSANKSFIRISFIFICERQCYHLFNRSGVELTGIKSACQMLVALGVHSHEVYVDEFETPFLVSTAEYYRCLSMSFLVSNSASLYVRKVEQCIREESERAKRYLDPQTEGKVLDVLENVLIKEHMNTVVNMEHSGVHVMLKDCERTPVVFVDVRLISLDYIFLLTFTVSDPFFFFTVPSFPKSSNNCVAQDLLELKERFDEFLLMSFQRDKMFKNRIQTEFETFINLNKNSPEYLSLYMDEKLRRGLRSENDENAERLLDKAMVLFRFLQEKDVFEKYYKQHMAKRLLLDKSISDDMERMMISKLKTECGCHFTLKLENMFRDKELWATQANHVRLASSIDISVRVLTAGMWPTQSVPVCLIFQMFSNFYVSKHSGRKLTLNTMLGTADVKAIFYSPVSADSSEVTETRKEENKILMVNTHQMVILMCFNNQPRITFQEIMNQTNIAERELKRNLQSLAMGKPTQRVLSRKGKGKDIDCSDEFYVNDNFQSKLTRIKVQLVTFKGESEPEKKETRAKVEDDRKHEIEAAIVRVMKSRKVLDHNNLITEVTQQLKHRFLPNPVLIKKRIESLIERDYLARDVQDLKLYNYVA
ncbi:unnamed protein product [Angiostrongylus costaricensis]|uniref:CULLIN_2 domain-containing protein n=1 Tax=Angiostrongylus costaricensis TaxID=334426 RepID=A0A0R3P9R4_ANGCS|nr:unnamed protein product [Angiostrongylus costaricensis]